MGKTLVAYFSAEGTTAKVAKELASSLGAELYEIMPEKPYTAADIKWTNPLARCNKEKFGGKDVPVAGKVEGFADYDTVLLGFPIWYGTAPNVVNTFCKGYDWTGKKVLAFATSGGSGIGKTAEKLRPYVEGAASVDAKLVRSAEEVLGWLK
ncbi:MAG: NAD(P)H-dependent oxidoreductase [Oscillospiraceae bacterium]|nr:NAD(P)H-dependent oxidoreductase [Oscillospiraceae bacterium]